MLKWAALALVVSGVVLVMSSLGGKKAMESLPWVIIGVVLGLAMVAVGLVLVIYQVMS